MIILLGLYLTFVLLGLRLRRDARRLLHSICKRLCWQAGWVTETSLVQETVVVPFLGLLVAIGALLEALTDAHFSSYPALITGTANGIAGAALLHSRNLKQVHRATDSWRLHYYRGK